MGAHHRWSSRSAARLATCDVRLQNIFNKVLLHSPHDTTITEGFRSNDRQQEMLDSGLSKLGPGKSKHNTNPSRAVDAAPLVNGLIDWKDREVWIGWANFVKGIASGMEIPLVWGGDWDGDFDSAEHGFWDGPHFELEN